VKGKRRQIAIVAGFVGLGVVVGLAGLLLAVLPQTSKASHLDTQIASLQTKLVSLHARPQRGPAIGAADLFSLARAMPDTADMPGIILDLSHASARSGAQLLTITPGAPLAQTDGSQALPITVVIGGSWTQVAAFLRALRLDVHLKGQKLKVGGRLFVADSVQLTGASGNKQEVQASLVLNAFTYGVAPVVTLSTDPTATTTTTTTSGSVQAAGAPGSAG
jgi:hypothetical protein